MITPLEDSAHEPLPKDELFIFSSPKFDALQYILLFHLKYVQNRKHGLNCKLLQLTNLVNCKLARLVDDQRISIRKIGKEFEHSLEFKSLEKLIRLYKDRVVVLSRRSISNRQLSLLQKPCQQILHDTEIDSVRELIDNGKTELAIDALMAAKALLSSPSQQQRLQNLSQNLRLVLLCKIHQQKALSQNKRSKLNEKSVRELTWSLSLLVILGNVDDAKSAFFDFQVCIHENGLGRIWMDVIDPISCSLKIASFCSEAIVSSYQQYQQIFAQCFSNSKFVAWATNRLKVASMSICELLHDLPSKCISEAIPELRSRLKLLSENGYNFWFLFEAPLTRLVGKKREFEKSDVFEVSRRRIF